MKELVKGTYRLNKGKRLKAKKKKTSSIEQFETKALEKLGGSIAFVSKSKLVWGGEDEKVK